MPTLRRGTADSAAAPAWAVLVFGAIIVQQFGVFYTGMSHGLLIDTDNWEGGARGADGTGAVACGGGETFWAADLKQFPNHDKKAVKSLVSRPFSVAIAEFCGRFSFAQKETVCEPALKFEAQPNPLSCYPRPGPCWGAGAEVKSGAGGACGETPQRIIACA